MSSVHKASTGWRARHRTPEGASRSRTFLRKADADRFLLEVEHSMLRGTYVEQSAGRVTVAEYAEDWIASKGAVRPRTRVNVEGRLRNHILPAFGDRRLSTIRRSDVQGWVTSLDCAPSTAKGIFLTFLN